MVIAYLRVSTTQQEKGLETQKHAIRAFCKSSGLQVSEFFDDFGISGAMSVRPGLTQVLEKVERGEVTHVVCYSLSRLGRSVKHILEVLELFKESNVNFISVSEKFDLSNAYGRMVVTVLGAVAELEREILRERVVSGLQNARSKGAILGRPTTADRETIKALLIRGATYREIAKICGCSHGLIRKVKLELGCS